MQRETSKTALTGGTLNVYSQIGLILVVGIMAKNGILIVEFANQLRDRFSNARAHEEARLEQELAAANGQPAEEKPALKPVRQLPEAAE